MFYAMHRQKSCKLLLKITSFKFIISCQTSSHACFYFHFKKLFINLILIKIDFQVK